VSVKAGCMVIVTGNGCVDRLPIVQNAVIFQPAIATDFSMSLGVMSFAGLRSA
jgi:hypothetical protein